MRPWIYQSLISVLIYLPFREHTSYSVLSISVLSTIVIWVTEALSASSMNDASIHAHLSLGSFKITDPWEIQNALVGYSRYSPFWDKHYSTPWPQVAWQSCHHPKKTVLKFTSHGFDLGANPGDFEKGIRLRNHPKRWWLEGFNAPCSVDGVSMVLYLSPTRPQLPVYQSSSISSQCSHARCHDSVFHMMHQKQNSQKINFFLYFFLYVHAKNIPCLQRFFRCVTSTQGTSSFTPLISRITSPSLNCCVEVRFRCPTTPRSLIDATRRATKDSEDAASGKICHDPRPVHHFCSHKMFNELLFISIII